MIATALAACCVFSLPVHAEKFESSSFLEWPRDSQEFYFRTSIGMAGLIAGRNDEAQGNCLSNWYFLDQKKATDHILDVMRMYPDHHPRGVILAVLEKRCGKLIYK